MLTTTVTSDTYRTASNPNAAGNCVGSSAPPIFVLPDVKATPHPVYGTIPIGRDGFTLERQNVRMLDFWHRKVDDLIQNFDEVGSSAADKKAEQDRFKTFIAIQWDIYNAAVKAKLNNTREVAILLGIVVRHLKTNCGGDSCEFLDPKDLSTITDQLVALTDPIIPKKRPGRLVRGEKLTRAGLLYRYHAFLLGELNTVGEELYGSAAYALQFKAEDRAVFERLGRRVVSQKGYPLFSHTRIKERAQVVLGSLQIDTERDLDAQRDDRGEVSKEARSYRRTR